MPRPGASSLHDMRLPPSPATSVWDPHSNECPVSSPAQATFPGLSIFSDCFLHLLWQSVDEVQLNRCLIYNTLCHPGGKISEILEMSICRALMLFQFLVFLSH